MWLTDEADFDRACFMATIPNPIANGRFEHISEQPLKQLESNLLCGCRRHRLIGEAPYLRFQPIEYCFDLLSCILIEVQEARRIGIPLVMRCRLRKLQSMLDRVRGDKCTHTRK